MLRRCDVHEKYFQGELQLRNPSDEVLVYFFDLVEAADESVWVVSEKKVKNGFDYKMSSNKFLRSLAEKLKAKFFGQIKVSATHHTRDNQRSKNLYRVTVLFRLAPFKRNEVFSIHGVDMKVVKIADKVSLKEIASGKRRFMEYEDVVLAYEKSQINH